MPLHIDQLALKGIPAMRRLGLALLVAAPFVSAAQAADLPSAFLGSWANRDGAGRDIEITGIAIGKRTYHEPGYNCDIRSVAAREEAGSIGRGRVYIVEMSCQDDGENPGKPSRVREVWAMRRAFGKEILVMSGASGPTFPSVRVLERAE